jgi:glutamate:Na+ symporter, ESS family
MIPLWTMEVSMGQFFMDFAFLGVLLFCAAVIRSKVNLFRKYLIPSNLIAGLMGLLIMAMPLSIDFLDTSRLGAYVYHLLALLFISFGLRSVRSDTGLTSFKFGLIYIVVYLIQALAGLLITFLLIYTVMPDLFAGVGLMVPLSFGMNPGISFSIGSSWEPYGFTDGGTVGLALAAIGFFVAYTGGMIMLKRGIASGKSSYLDIGTIQSSDTEQALNNENQAGKITIFSGNIESLSLHWALIGLTYTLTWLLLTALSKTLIYAGLSHEIPTLWSFHFVFAAISALLIRRIIDSVGLSSWIDDTTMTRTGNLFMDYMVVASIAAITIAVLKAYLLPLILLGTVAAVITWWVIAMATRDLFSGDHLERNLSIFGNLTGTMQSALVLLRVADPNHRSSISQELVYGSGIALVLGFPLLLIINAPVLYFDNKLSGYWIVAGVILTYLTMLLLVWKYLKKKNGM